MTQILEKYLLFSEALDFNHSLVKARAEKCAEGMSSKKAIAEACFEFVRDEIHHSGDHRSNTVTYKASEVLEHKTGYCYAKSHLLAALLRANSIPAGLCYQRLRDDGPETPFVLHGFVALYLDEFGWYRVDARGNKEGVDAQFNPPKEQLAFANDHPGEYTFPGIWSESIWKLRDVLISRVDYTDILKEYPDIEVIEN